MKIKLLGPHKHDCTEYPAGAEIDLDDHAAQWLIRLGKAKRVLEPEETSARDLKDGGDAKAEAEPKPVRKRGKIRNVINAG